jgi:hypothetical protein
LIYTLFIIEETPLKIIEFQPIRSDTSFRGQIAEDEFLRECRFMIIHKKMSVKKKMKISRNDRIYFPVYRWKSTNNMSFT